MIAWLAGLPIRMKIWGAAAGVVLLSLLGLWTAWRLAAAKAATATARAKALQQARESEIRIKNRQDALRLKQQRLREQLKVSENRDHFESGWGP